MNKALHSRDDVDRLYASRTVGEKRIAGIEDSVDTLVQQLEDYIEKYETELTASTRHDTGTRLKTE